MKLIKTSKNNSLIFLENNFALEYPLLLNNYLLFQVNIINLIISQKHKNELKIFFFFIYIYKQLKQ
jgi:hypothetical protein